VVPCHRRATVGEADDPEDEQRFGQRLARLFAAASAWRVKEVEVEASLGVNCLEPVDAPSADVALARADACMYEAERRR
jgi:GGDEF domain-containing protein